MSAEPQEYAIADLLANAIEPWDSLTARDLQALGAGAEQDSSPTAPVVIAAYRNERGPVLIDGSQRLQWLAGPPRNRTVISADEVRVDPTAVDEESAHRAAVALHVNRRPASARVKAELARRLHAQFGWSQATIAEVFKVSRPAVSNWVKQWAGADVPEVTGADGTIYPARGKLAEPDTRVVGGTVSDALKALHAEHQGVVARHPSLRHIRIDRHGTADPDTWTVTVAGRAGDAVSSLASQLRDQANDLISLARKLDQANP
ncbi:MAG TPA: helix-turn-helix domain-containing protein [Streptosporangiaceae bacterium]|nr:helix-turn-helix domain-containing protein [Streptosporangiaceae bacterium]